MKIFSKNNKDLEFQVSKRFKYSMSFLGFSIITILTHKYLVKNYPKTARDLYVDKLLNDNTEEEKQMFFKRIVRISYNYREYSIVFEYP